MPRGELPEVIRGLLEPSAYPHPADTVDLVQTHISYVFLAGDFVYKVKKPVDFGFLDFTHPGEAPALLRGGGAPEPAPLPQHVPGRGAHACRGRACRSSVQGRSWSTR